MIDPISWAYSWPYILAGFAGGYLLGALPFGLILTRLAGMGDIRAIGSGNIGATNVLRTGNKKIAAATLILDGAKGAAAVLIARAMIGHLFPVWLKFRGGKGVATALGILLALAPAVGGLACATWLLAAVLFRYSSLSALLAMAAAPVYMWWLADPQRKEFAIAMALLVWMRHWQNIRRLATGAESKITLSRKS